MALHPCTPPRGTGSSRICTKLVHTTIDKVENGRKRTENRSIVFVFIFLDENGSGSRTAGNENGSGINGNTKTGKYDRKIDGNKR
jgi:hypothetical protein